MRDLKYDSTFQPQPYCNAIGMLILNSIATQYLSNNVVSYESYFYIYVPHVYVIKTTFRIIR